MHKKTDNMQCIIKFLRFPISDLPNLSTRVISNKAVKDYNLL